MISTIQVLILLLAVVAGVAVVANQLKIPPAILLVLAGVLLALVPGLPPLELAPELVLLLILPPVIYISAFLMSWREFHYNLRPITLLSVGGVVFTTLAVAAAANLLMDLEWPIGLLLGAIISPPDAIAPLSIARRMEIPQRIRVILEGEGLADDATALILYRFALVAISVGIFSFWQAAGMFAAIVAGEILWGLGVGWLMLRLRQWVNDPLIEIVLSILTPFLAFWPPAHLGGSGVLATLTAGLYVSWNGPRLISSATRLQGVFLGVLHLCDRGHGVPDHWTTSAHSYQPHRRVSTFATGHLRCGHHCRGNCGSVCLGLSCRLPNAMGVPSNQKEGPIAAVAVAISAGIHRCTRHRFARGSARYSAGNFYGTAISLS